MHNTVITWQRKRNEVTREIRYAKLNYQNKKIDQINSGNIHVKEWYKLTKQLFNKQSSTTIPTLKYEGKTASDDIDKVNLLNTVFCKQATIDSEPDDLPTNFPCADSRLLSFAISPQDVKDAVSVVDPSKACSPDMIIN